MDELYALHFTCSGHYSMQQLALLKNMVIAALVDYHGVTFSLPRVSFPMLDSEQLYSGSSTVSDAASIMTEM